MKNKILCVILSLMMIFSVCNIPFSVNALDDNSYYVINGGEGTGRTVNDPAGSVAEVIATINEDFPNVTDIANIYIMQRDDWNTAVDSQAAHNITYWGMEGTVPEHNAKIVVQSYGDTVNYLAFSGKAGYSRDLIINGPTEFKNIRMVSAANEYRYIQTNDYDVTFGTGVIYGYIPYGAFTGTVSNRNMLGTYIGSASATEAVTDSINLTFKNKLSCNGTKHGYVNLIRTNPKRTYFNSYNVIFDLTAGSGCTRIRLGDSKATTFENNLNINFKTANSFGFYRASSYGSFTVNGALQIIKNKDAQFGNLASETTTSIVDDPNFRIDTQSGVTVNGGVWYITNNTDNNDFISYTDIAGTFNIAQGCEAIATDSIGNVFYSDNGVLVLAEGEYTVEEYFPPKTKDYYVINGGTGDGRTSDTPAGSVEAVLASVNEDLPNSQDTANIYIMQRADWNTSVDKSAIHNITYWGTDGSVPKHKAKIIVQSYGNTVNYLAYNSKAGYSRSLNINGPTEFKNIKIVCNTYEYQYIYTYDNDVTFGSGVSYGTMPNGAFTGTVSNRNMLGTAIGSSTATVEETETINLNFENKVGCNGTAHGYVYLARANPKKTYTSSYNINFDLEPNTSWTRIRLGDSNATVYENDLNLSFKSANSFGFRRADTYGSFTINGALQIIKNENAVLSSLAADNVTSSADTEMYRIEKQTGVTVNGGVYYLTVPAQIPDIVEFSNQAGTYFVKDKYDAIAVNDITGERIESLDGILTLTAGEWTITAKKQPVIKDYYVKSVGYEALDSGNYDKGLGTKESPAATVADLVDIINASGELAAGDTANVYILQRDDFKEYDGSAVGKNTEDSNLYLPYHNFTSWQHGPKNVSSTLAPISTHDYTLAIKADPNLENADNGKIYIAYGDVIGNAYMHLSGPTVFEDVTILCCRTYYNAINAYGNSVTFGENCTFAGINKNYSSGYTAWDGVIKHYNILPSTLLSGNTTDNIDINFNGVINKQNNQIISLGGGTHTGNINITVDNQKATPTIKWGSSNLTASNINIYIKNGALINDYGTNTVTLNNLNILAENSTTISNLEATLTALNITNYYLLRNTGDIGTVSNKLDSDGNIVPGQFVIASGNDAIAYHSDGTIIEPDQNGLLDLTSKFGEYSLIVKKTPVESNKYSEFINYRGFNDSVTNNYNGALANTYKKLSENKKLNIVYFGGSVTVGTGSESAGRTGSWRVRIGNWLENNFYEADVNNISQAIGETGTNLGALRFKRDVLPEEPDLMFIEYSINDYYDGASYFRAAAQYETIVRTLKEQYPDCDIVTILVTDYFNVSAAANGNLHTQAQAHESIAEKYNISTIHVGRALATQLVNEGWTKQSSWKTDTKWLEYFSDSVHPLNKGYGVYYNAIEEFMTNTLYFGGYDTATIQEQKLPKLVSKYIFDGGNTFIDESDSNVSFSDGVTHSPESQGILSNYKGLLKFAAGSEDTVTVKFNGTELAMIVTGGGDSTDNNFTYSIDNGETWSEPIAYGGKNPTYIVKGLQSGEHTVVIKPAGVNAVSVDCFYSRDVQKSTGKFDIRDLVYLDETLNDTTIDYRDYNNSGAIDQNDIVTLKKILLNCEFPFDYYNYGQKIEVYKESVIDVTKEEHTEIEGKLFIGWQKQDGTYPNGSATYLPGDSLTAVYTDLTAENFTTKAQIVSENDTYGVSFVQTLEAEEKFTNLIDERGTLWLTTAQTYGADMYLDEKVIIRYTAGKTTGDFNTYDVEGKVPNKVVSEQNIGNVSYSITDITEDNYNTYYAAKGYIKYTNLNGVEGIAYTDQAQTSLYKLAAEKADKTTAEQAIVDYVETTRVENYWTSNGLTKDGLIDDTTETQYLTDSGCGCTDKTTCTHKIFQLPSSGKLFVRDIKLDTTGFNVEPIQMALLTDTHFNYVNKKDIETNSISLSSYRGRGDFRKHQQWYVDYGRMKFVSMFRKTVLAGDAMDYLSYGGLNALDRLVTKQSVNNLPVKKYINGSYTNTMGGTISMTLGNHDPKQLSSPVDSTLKETLSQSTAYELVKPYFTNDLYYDSEILLKKDGSENIMMIYLDNNYNHYWESQIEPLTRDLTYARENNIPVLIFQHVPLRTMNENETKFKYIAGFNHFNKFAPQDDSCYDISGNTYTIKTGLVGAGTKVSVVNMTTHSGYTGLGTDQATDTVYNLIRQHSDVVKGVFAGHIHAHTETNIVGINEDGTANGEYIKQYTGYLTNYGSISRIIVE